MVSLARCSGRALSAASGVVDAVVGVMNRKERRLAARLGVEWVGMDPSGWIEVCLGGPGCGCGETDGPQTRSGEDRPYPSATSEATEEPWPFAG